MKPAVYDHLYDCMSTEDLSNDNSVFKKIDIEIDKS